MKGLPKYGNKVSYVMEDGTLIKGKVLTIDNYLAYMTVTVLLGNGKLYHANLKKQRT